MLTNNTVRRHSLQTGSGVEVLILALTSTSHQPWVHKPESFVYFNKLLEILWVFPKLSEKVRVCITTMSLRNPFIYLPIKHTKLFSKSDLLYEESCHADSNAAQFLTPAPVGIL